MNKRTFTQKLTDFLNGRGFYIALALCVTAIGVSGWYLWRGFTIASELAEETGRSQAVTVVPEEEMEETISPEETDPADTQPPQEEEEAPAEQEATQAEAAEGGEDAQETAAPVEDVPAESGKTEEAEQTAQTEETAPEEPSQQDKAEPAEDALAEEQPEWVWPLQGAVVAAFSSDTLTYNPALGDWRTHNGVDLAAKLGDTVSAAHAGKVVAVEDDHLLGRTVTVNCGEGLKTVYGNLSQNISVKAGDRVKAGDELATVGDTAAGEANESAWLHFSVEKDGTPVDPMEYLK